MDKDSIPCANVSYQALNSDSRILKGELLKNFNAAFDCNPHLNAAAPLQIYISCLTFCYEHIINFFCLRL